MIETYKILTQLS